MNGKRPGLLWLAKLPRKSGFPVLRHAAWAAVFEGILTVN